MQVEGVVLCLFLVSGILAEGSRRLGNLIDEDGYSGRQADIVYDEYPIVVPKRSALLLDRLMVALHHALEEEEGSGSAEDVRSLVGSQPAPPAPRIAALTSSESQFDSLVNPRPLPLQRMSLTRRGQGAATKGRVWKCYFNAVTCFRK